MGFETAAPCRHRGAPPDDLVNQVTHLLEEVVAKDEPYLQSKGISVDEFECAFPSAIERIRGSWAANNRDRRDFAEIVVKHLAQTKVIKGYDVPRYGDSTIYRLMLKDGKHIGVIQKGCPDGAHSSTRWERPSWADELYLWWLCSSLKFEPGEHVWKGISRVRKKVAREAKNQLDGVVFFNSLCGSPQRPCPKELRNTIQGGITLPPPCIYIFPGWKKGENELNWRGTENRRFPAVLLSAFGVARSEAINHVGYVGFRISGSDVRTEITARFGPARTSSARG